MKRQTARIGECMRLEGVFMILAERMPMMNFIETNDIILLLHYRNSMGDNGPAPGTYSPLTNLSDSVDRIRHRHSGGKSRGGGGGDHGSFGSKAEVGPISPTALVSMCLCLSLSLLILIISADILVLV
jgi:hypothetical protein